MWLVINLNIMLSSYVTQRIKIVHMLDILEYAYYILHIIYYFLKEHIVLKSHKNFGYAIFYCQSYKWLYVSSVIKFLFDKKHTEGCSTCLDGMECKDHSNHSQDLTKLGTAWYIPIPTSNENVIHLSWMVLILSLV